MSKTTVTPSRPLETSPAPTVYPDDVEPELRATLSALAHIETQYEQQRASLARWAGPASIRQRLAHELEERHRKDREPYVQRLADLHMRVLSMTMFRGLRTTH